MNARHTARCIASFSAAAAMTATLLGSQLGLAAHYTAQADALMAARAASAPLAAANKPAQAPQRRG
ncbi:hypothetical protein [Aquabacterium sp.]|uniref:hypothetical protein n=1 Tax=Aquabacterium sp. TaxID=1872578 RepID=UPI0037850122